MKLRGGIVRCGACNEVFDGNAALVEPALKQPVIIDLPAAPTPAPTSSPELDALITTLDARAEDGELELEAEPAPEPAPAPVMPGDEAFDLDLDLDVELDTEPGAEPEDEPVPEAVDAAPAAEEEASDDALPAPEAEPPRPEYPPLSALDDEDRVDHEDRLDAPLEDADGRREPTLDLPDEHLTAVALHDSFELDAFPPRSEERSDSAEHRIEPGAAGEDDDDDVVTLSSAATAAAAAATGPATPVSAGQTGRDADGADDDEPGFVKRDRRRKQVGKAARVAMALGVPLLLAALAAQVLGTFRNPLAAAVPSLKPALVSACALAGCTVDLPAQIDALSIEQGELQTLAENVFSFTTTLRNGARTAQAWPHIELILNDDAGKPVLRRVFAPRDYLAPAAAAGNAAGAADLAKGFAPRSEQSVKLYFELAQVKASGYHIAVFYP
ncbi:DUF3426 domain-containing protein [Massilia sp. FT127W]|uniref:DUF3426 domain-containing protein n=1 Tax=Pseudoduganella aquatica TaxID=2660641 RepID=A0A7X4KNT0_9BURK|nr:DUF3426 domain-containing protein [Pseudoduganella aquatica]